jgi:hypothetical protein
VLLTEGSQAARLFELSGADEAVTTRRRPEPVPPFDWTLEDGQLDALAAEIRDALDRASRARSDWHDG